MQLRYLPALNAPTLGTCVREGCLSDGSTPAAYPHALLSYHHWKKTHVPPSWRDRGYVFGDSGGFSVRTLGVEIDPVEDIQWQAENTSAGCLLDVPPMDIRGRPCFDDSLSRTATNTRAALPLYEALRKDGDPFRWWGVVHGQFGTQVAQWWKTIAGVYPFDQDGEGWCFGPEPTITPVTVAHMLRQIRLHGVRRAHFFKATSPKVVATLAVLGEEAGLAFVSFDSASISRAAANRNLMVKATDGVGWTWLREQSRKGATHADRWRVREYLWERCPCASCAELRAAYGGIEAVRDGVWVCRFFLHNVLVQVEAFEALAAEAVRDGEALLRDLLGRRDYYVVKLAAS